MLRLYDWYFRKYMTIRMESPTKKLNIHNLPFEMILELFRYLSYEQVCVCSEVCRKFNSVASSCMKDGLRGLSPRAEREIQALHTKVKPKDTNNYEHNYNIATSLTFLRYMWTEIKLLEAMMWHYVNDKKMWSLLFPKMGSMLDKFYEYIKKTNAPKEKSYPFWNWVKCLEDTERNILAQEIMKHRMIPFGTKVIDILHCCPSANFQAEIVAKVNNTFTVSYFFELRGLSKTLNPPVIDVSGLSPEERERRILCYLRRCVRWYNAKYVYDIITDLPDFNSYTLSKSIFADDEVDVYFNTVYEDIKEPYRPIRAAHFMGSGGMFTNSYWRYSLFDMHANGIICKIKLDCDSARDLPMIFHKRVHPSGSNEESVKSECTAIKWRLEQVEGLENGVPKKTKGSLYANRIQFASTVGSADKTVIDLHVDYSSSNILEGMLAPISFDVVIEPDPAHLA